MENYCKLYHGILTSSVWQKPLSWKIVWITILALKDAEGRVRGSVGWLAMIAGVPRKDAVEALEAFLSPDPDSRSQEHEGRRIEAIEGGWRVLNHSFYRDVLEDQRQRWRRQKAAQRQRKNANVATYAERAYEKAIKES